MIHFEIHFMQYSVIYSQMHMARQLFLGEIVEKKMIK